MSLRYINKLNKKFEETVNMLLDSMRLDMDMAHSGGQSTMDMHRLKDVNNGMKSVGACRDIVKDCYLLLRDTVGTQEVHKSSWVSHKDPDADEETESLTGAIGSSGITAVDFAKAILEMAESPWVDAESYNSLVMRSGVPPGEKKVDFIQRTIALIKRLPPKIIDNETREKVVEAGQEYLDRAIEEEEEMYEEE